MPQPLIGIVGLGYVGLPLVRAFVSCGASVIGFDVDQRKVDSLQQGKSYIRHLDSSWLQVAIESKTFRPTHDMSRLE